jgi:hypothetical protein
MQLAQSYVGKRARRSAEYVSKRGTLACDFYRIRVTYVNFVKLFYIFLPLNPLLLRTVVEVKPAGLSGLHSAREALGQRQMILTEA